MRILSCTLFLAVALAAQSAGWPAYGGTVAGTRYSAASQITVANVAQLKLAWTFHTSALAGASDFVKSKAAFEATPILHNGVLYLSTPLDQVIALDAGTGVLRWKYDPRLKEKGYSEISSRGVAFWSGGDVGACAQRVFIGTLDARLIALDAATGRPCGDFGRQGQVDLSAGVDVYGSPGNYQVTSPPTVVGGRVIVGSSIGDNRAVSLEKGVVRAYDVRSGMLIWTWDPIPWAEKQNPRTGAANAWSVISADPARDLIFVPTGSASPDYYGGLRPGDDADSDSVVALSASSGKKVWAFQLTHHDLWDFDVAAQPLLFTWKDGSPAIAVTNKSGNLFVLNRLTGKPLVPITERTVPQSDVPGEHTSPTQPFSSLPPLTPQLAPRADQVFALNPADRAWCEAQIQGARNNGLYTPPSLKGSVTQPGNVGGVNWGSAAYDPVRHFFIADVNTLIAYARLIPRADFSTAWDNREKNRMTGEFAPQRQTPYALYRNFLLANGKTPCNPFPWGSIVAMDLYQGKIAWSVPLGSLLPGESTGSPNLGGAIATAGGLVFAAATMDYELRAFDTATGKVVWEAPLPAGGQATPMTYMLNGKQYVVLCAGGHGKMGTRLGDSVLAYALGGNNALR